MLLAVLVGCYSPAPREGAPCDTTKQCPMPQRCVLGRCWLGDAPPIDASLERPDAPVDAAVPIDAMRPACSTAGLTCSGTPTMFTCGGNCWVRCPTSVSRDTARAACAGWTGGLGEINDATEQSCVATGSAAGTWIGLVQNSTATTPGTGWTWNGTTPVIYTHWRSGKPDDADNNENGAEQCASMQLDGTWDDDDCSSPRSFLCERP